MEGHDHQSCFGACGVSRALHRLSGLTSSPDWLIALSADVTIGPIRFVYLCFVQFYAAVVVKPLDISKGYDFFIAATLLGFI